MSPWVLVTYRVAVVVGFVWLAGGHEMPAIEESARVLRTSPTCDDIVGYSGPNDCEIRLDGTGRVEAVRLVRSGDTVEHADAVREDPAFFRRFVGLDADDPRALATVDGVSRATLTSLAIVEAVAKRLSGQRPSLRFPSAITVEEVRALQADAHDLGARDTLRFGVRGAGGDELGFVVRTGPLTEAVVGYQGPTETLLLFDENDVLRGMRIRRSYDNEKYVGWVRDDPLFAEQFVGRPLGSLAADRAVDGVSGATMTSLAVANGIARTAARLLQPPPRAVRGPRMHARDVGTIVAIAIALLLTFSRLRGNRRLRVVTRVAVIVYLGIVSGDMLSQGLLVGWAANGMPLAAPGLVALFAAAFLVPATTGRQTYCHQLCAHGALQELLRRSPWQRPTPAALTRRLRHLPAVLLLFVAVSFGVGLWVMPYGAIEPFGAWAWPLAGAATVVLWVVSVAVSSLYSMAYCRMGCPTGALLDFVRLRRRGRFRLVDLAAGLVVLVVAATRAM